MAPKLPVIFIFDLDSTLICSTYPLLGYNQFIDFLRDAISSKKIDLPNVTLATARARPMSELVPDEYFRCDIGTSMKALKTLFPTAVFVVFSAGEKAYVEKNVKLIEERFGVCIQRPIFSREHCTIDETNRYRKSILANLPRLMNALQEHYPALKQTENIERVVKHNMVFVDDNDVVWDLKAKWIPCPIYEYMHVIDVTAGLPRTLLQHQLVRDYINTHSVGFAEPPPEQDISEDERNLMFHSYLANMYRLAFTKNKEALKDDFFKRFVSAVKPLSKLQKPFTEKNLQHIRDTMEKKK